MWNKGIKVSSVWREVCKTAVSGEEVQHLMYGNSNQNTGVPVSGHEPAQTIFSGDANMTDTQTMDRAEHSAQTQCIDGAMDHTEVIAPTRTMYVGRGFQFTRTQEFVTCPIFCSQQTQSQYSYVYYVMYINNLSQLLGIRVPCSLESFALSRS